jgi:hypothetical protein
MKIGWLNSSIKPTLLRGVTLPMTDAVEMLRELQNKIVDRDRERLIFAEVKGLLHIEFYGQPWGNLFSEFVNLICHPHIASNIGALIFRSPDEGANGTNNWDFSEFTDSKALFPNITTFFVEPYQPEWHNQPIIAQIIEEEGAIAKLLAKMPNLISLTVPNAPDASFFEVGIRPLSYLRVESGYDRQNFIQNLSRSLCFPNLEFFDFGDYNEQYIDNYQENCTPFEDYVDLFKSKAFEKVAIFVLRNPLLSQSQLQKLKNLRQRLTFRLIKSYGDYV